MSEKCKILIDIHNSNNQTKKQEFLIPTYSLNYDKNFDFKIELSYAFSLNDNYDNFKMLEFNLNREYDLSKKSKIIADLKGGASSKNTPFNYQFTAGAFSKKDGGIPIRGQDYEFAGTRYFKNNLEYQRLIWGKNWWEVVFVDTAKIVSAEQTLGDLDWENDAGYGLIYYSYLGPIRADIAFDNADRSPVFNIGFGSSF